MKRLIIHVGMPKCASTSIQQAVKNSKEVYFPESGVHDTEHLAIPLKIKGVDDWTRQWFDDEWAENEFQKIINEICELKFKDSINTIFLSSERLADCNEIQLSKLVSYFPDFDIEFLLIRRDKDAFIKSNWRHAVFRHDLSDSFDSFYKKMLKCDLDFFYNRFKSSYKIKLLDIDCKDWVKELSTFIGATNLVLNNENVSASFECCKMLSLMHRELGTDMFQSFFNHERKVEFSELFKSPKKKSITQFTDPIF
ncbi:hypothetical protein ACJJH9_03130 [Microbulbifer sp. DLAB2-AF]|uniref:hypothetical protein n=1 Tax=Microbulbifer sp. DLAB2-AF TaxID=3243395 RepID=UPI0040398A8C